MEFTLRIEAPALVDAINSLAAAIAGIVGYKPIITDPTPMQGGMPDQMAMQQVTAPVQIAPVQTAPVQQVPVQTAPTQQAPVQTAPVQQPMNQAPVQTVPTTAQTYTMEQLAVAATQLVDAQRRNELVALLAQFGVQALTALPKERYGEFATQLRALGARI